MVLPVFLAALLWTVTGQSTVLDSLWCFVNILCQQRNSLDGSLGEPMQSAGGNPSSLLMPPYKACLASYDYFSPSVKLKAGICPSVLNFGLC